MPASWRRWAYGVALAACFLVPAARPVAAADFAEPWEVGAYAVYTVYDNDTTISDTPGWGVRGGWQFKPRHAVELSFDTASADNSTKGSTITFDIQRIRADYLHNLKAKKPDSKLGAFILFGVGQMDYDNGTDSDSTTLFETGGGLRILMTKKLALRFDGKIFHLHGDSVIIPRDAFYSFDFNAGVSFFFGQGK